MTRISANYYEALIELSRELVDEIVGPAKRKRKKRRRAKEQSNG